MPTRRGMIALAAALLIGATGAGAQQALDPGQLVGVWQGYEQTGDLVILAEVQFFDNFTYQKVVTVAGAYAFQSGEWSLAGNWLHFVPTDYEPKEVAGIRQHPPPSETWVVQHFDERGLIANVGYTQMNYQRVQ